MREDPFEDHLKDIMVDAFSSTTVELYKIFFVSIPKSRFGAEKWSEEIITELFHKVREMCANNTVITGRLLYELYKTTMIENVAIQQEKGIFHHDLGELYVRSYIIEKTKNRDSESRFLENEIFLCPDVPITGEKMVENGVPVFIRGVNAIEDREEIKNHLAAIFAEIHAIIAQLCKKENPKSRMELVNRLTAKILDDLAEIILTIHLSGKKITKEIMIEKMVGVVLKVFEQEKENLKEYDPWNMRMKLRQIRHQQICDNLVPEGWSEPSEPKAFRATTFPDHKRQKSGSIKTDNVEEETSCGEK